MGKIIKNGIEYSGAKPTHIYLTQAEYDALPSTKTSDGMIYFITDRGTESFGNVAQLNYTVVSTWT